VRVLLVHQNFPAQFRHLAPALVAAGHDVAAIGNRSDLAPLAGLRYLPAGGAAADVGCGTSPEEHCRRQLAQGRHVALQLQTLARERWRPDVVVGHPFWGDLLFLDDVFPEVPLVALMELDLLAVPRLDGRHHGALTGLLQWTTLQAARRMAIGLTATGFQQRSFPSWLQPRIAVIHEGVDLQQCRPRPLASLRLPDGTVLRSGEPLVSFCCRSLEPLRGFDTFLRALPPLQRAHPGVRVVICGDEACSYGPPPVGGGSWKQRLLGELGSDLDLRRVHFVGRLPHGQLLDLFRLASVHVYLTAPFVLSWSLLEAMACGALVVGSRTAPVQELIRHGQEGLLVPFDQPEALASAVLEPLRQPARFAPLRLAARRRIVRDYDQRACVGRQLQLIGAVARGETLPPPFARGENPPVPRAGPGDG